MGKHPFRKFGKIKNSSVIYFIADPAGFEPAIYGLGGRRLIHARLRALFYPPKKHQSAGGGI